MQDDKSLTASARATAVMAVKRLAELKTKPQLGLTGIIKYLLEGHKQRGRPLGQRTHVDDARVERMEKHLDPGGKAKSVYGAAMLVAKELESAGELQGAMVESVAHRLYDRFNERWM